MKAKDLGVVFMVAAVTLAAGWLCLPPERTANASNRNSDQAVRQAPSLQHQGVVLSLQAERRAYQVGERPGLRLTAVNASGASRRIPVQIHMASAAPASKMSRVIALPVEQWSQELLVELAPGQSRTLRIEPTAGLLPDRQATFTLSIAEQPARSTHLSIAPRRSDVKIGTLPRVPVGGPSG